MTASSNTNATDMSNAKSEKLTMNPHLKRTSALFAVIAIYLVGFKSTKILTKVPYVERKEQKQISERQSELDIQTSVSEEPYRNRWQRRFSNNTQGYFFFKHIRKAGGTSLRSYFHDVFNYHGVRYTTRDDYSRIHKGKIIPDVLYVEHEFQTMDSECASVDGRWDKSLRVITLRNPIERHMSEFFFSGYGTKFHIDRSQLYTNETYTKQLSDFLNEYVPLWMEQEGGGKNFVRKYGDYERRFHMYFGRFYRNNFQLRAMAGCSSDQCLKKRLGNDTAPLEIQQLHPLTNSTIYETPKPMCTQYFHKQDVLFDPCAKSARKNKECHLGCDGPCFYPSVAWGPLDDTDVTRAIKALDEFDLVLLMETFDDPDQSAFMADVLGVPRDAEFALSNHEASYVRVQKTNKHDKAYFYRDLLKKLSPTSLELLTKENQLEIDFIEKAIEVNRRKTEQWKTEINWELP